MARQSRRQRQSTDTLEERCFSASALDHFTSTVFDACLSPCWRAIEPTGHALHASETLLPGSRLVSIPFDLAITPSASRKILPAEATAGLSDHAAICLYLILLDLQLQDTAAPLTSPLRHLEYARTLPRQEQMQTALWFTDDELDLLRGSNLYPAVHERRREWEAEYNSIKAEHLAAVQMNSALFTWRVVCHEKS